MTVSVVIPVYLLNQELMDTTYECLESLYGTTGVDEVIVVDDGSPLKIDGTWFTVVEREKNGGFAAAVNSGLSKASGDAIIVCNNDVTFIQPDWLKHVLDPLENGYGIVSLRTTDADGWDVEDRLEDNAKFGSFWAITREALEAIGYLDERFGHGTFEDLDYWHRAQDAKVKICKNHAGIVEHHGKKTFKVIDPEDMLYGRNMFKYKEKWGDTAHIFETAPDSIILLDDYEIEDERRRDLAKKKSITLEEARSRWSNA